MLAAALVLIAAGSALAVKKVTKVRIQAGDIVVNGEGGFTPTALPKNVDAPITLFGRGNISTVSGDYPPILETIEFEFDKHGSVDTTGLPKCTRGQTAGDDGAGGAQALPGRDRRQGAGHRRRPLPRTGADQSQLADHALQRARASAATRAFSPTPTSTVPAPTTFIVPVRIETIRNGRYGYRVHARIPKIAGGAGHPLSGSLTVGRKWTFKGKKHSFVNARCADGRLQALGEFGFKDGTR